MFIIFVFRVYFVSKPGGRTFKIRAIIVLVVMGEAYIAQVVRQRFKHSRVYGHSQADGERPVHIIMFL